MMTLKAEFSLNDPILSVNMGRFCCNCLKLQLKEFYKVNCGKELVIFHWLKELKYPISKESFVSLWENSMVKQIEEQGSINIICPVADCIKCLTGLLRSNFNTSTASGSVSLEASASSISDIDVTRGLSRIARLSKADVEELEKIPLMFGTYCASEGICGEELNEYKKIVRGLLIDCSSSQLYNLQGVCRRKKWKSSTCLFCPLPIGPQIDFFAHVLSENHLPTMQCLGVYPLKKDFDMIIETISAVLRSEEEKNRPSLPFFFGSPSPEKRVADHVLNGALRFYRHRMSRLAIDNVVTVMERDYKRKSKCYICDIPLGVADRLSHVMTDEHLKKLVSQRRFITSWDLNSMHELILRVENI